ncbi:MAG: hypothetical protein ACMZ64_06635 [Oleiphilus sp.]
MYEKLIWKVACVILVITSTALFIPALSSVYSAYARYAIYIAFLLGVIATLLNFKVAVQKGGTAGYVLATIKFLVLSTIFAISYTMFAVTHSGI